MTAQFKGAFEPDLGQAALLDTAGDGHGFYRNYFKRFIDLVLVLSTAPITLPLIVLLALIASNDGSAPFYRQYRVGRNGRVFRLLKIRTMVPEADRMLSDYLASDPVAREEWNRSQKLRRDPRITPFGRFLRKTSLDELPQLWNVLKGEMSLIGPRPMMIDQTGLYPGAAYYALRPGITGSWQVAERNGVSFATRAKFDTEYYRSLSLGTDLSILLKTFQVVIRGTGC